MAERASVPSCRIDEEFLVTIAHILDNMLVASIVEAGVSAHVGVICFQKDIPSLEVEKGTPHGHEIHLHMLIGEVIPVDSCPVHFGEGDEVVRT